LIRGFWWAFRYNFGSLAFGSFLLAIIWTIRVVFEYVDKKLKNFSDNNAAAKCISNMVRCCLDCCHRFIKFINTNAYIQVALTGENFCSSAMAAFVLALKHSSTFFITNGIGTLIMLLGKLTISVGNTVIGYLMVTNIKSINSELESPIPPLFVIFVISYLMASVFMSVYYVTSLTVLQCLYVDVDICNQKEVNQFKSQNRPVEMEDIIGTLRKI